MIEIKQDGQIYQVVTYHTFKTWVRRVALAFALLSVGVTVGVWSLTNHSKDTLTSSINKVVVQSCIAETKQKSTSNKYNDLVDDLIESRNKQLDIDIAEKDVKGIKDDNAAIDRYRSDKITVPTKEQCMIPILKG